VNFSSQSAQCRVRIPFANLAGRPWRLRDMIGTEVYQRDGDDLHARGLYLNVPPWQCHVFEVKTVEPDAKPDDKTVKSPETHGHRNASHQR
jgi:hypothetical protein